MCEISRYHHCLVKHLAAPFLLWRAIAAVNRTCSPLCQQMGTITVSQARYSNPGSPPVHMVSCHLVQTGRGPSFSTWSGYLSGKPAQLHFVGGVKFPFGAVLCSVLFSWVVVPTIGSFWTRKENRTLFVEEIDKLQALYPVHARANR